MSVKPVLIKKEGPHILLIWYLLNSLFLWYPQLLLILFQVSNGGGIVLFHVAILEPLPNLRHRKSNVITLITFRPWILHHCYPDITKHGLVHVGGYETLIKFMKVPKKIQFYRLCGLIFPPIVICVVQGCWFETFEWLVDILQYFFTVG